MIQDNIRYKLTDINKQTHNGYQLPENGIWYYPSNRKDTCTPCSDTALHHYSHPLLAILFNPIHASYKNCRLFKSEVDCEYGTDRLKGWCTAQKVISELEVPKITLEQKIAFAIYCAEYTGNTSYIWQTWAYNWMHNIDRSAGAACNVTKYAYYDSFAADAAANAATKAATANKFIAYAADAAYATYAAADRHIANAAAKAAAANRYIADAATAATNAANAANADAETKSKIDFTSIIQRVITSQIGGE